MKKKKYLSSKEKIDFIKSNPISIGLSSIGSKITVIPENQALRIKFGTKGKNIYAPIGPGLIAKMKIKEWELFSYEKTISLNNYSGTIALDGEREFEIYNKNKIEITLEKTGPFVLDVIKSVQQENLL